MAASMLKLGRLGTLKCLRQDGWGSVRTPLTAAFCTKTEAPKKPAKKASSKKAPAAPAPEPEPFDNTTYKNLQHHNYNIYTFVDGDVEMAKYRLPQPSTGRPSPRN